MALRGSTPAKVNEAVQTLKPFKIGNVSGRAGLDGLGQLPESHAVALLRANRFGLVKYVLYSYETPMAWLVDGDGWTQPLVNYSLTTSNHQSVFARAIRSCAGV